MTYKQAYDKIIDAYFNDEIRPYDACFCFCGTLCNNSNAWSGHSSFELNTSKHNDFMGYRGVDFSRMEVALLSKYREVGNEDIKLEDKLFAGMCAALEVLKQIHIERGETIDEVPVFNKRQQLIS